MRSSGWDYTAVCLMWYPSEEQAQERACSTVLFAQSYIVLAPVTLGMLAVFCYVIFCLTEQPSLCEFFLAVNGRPWFMSQLQLLFSMLCKQLTSCSGSLGGGRSRWTHAVVSHSPFWSTNDIITWGCFPQISMYRRPSIPSPAPSLLMFCPCLFPPDSTNQPSITSLIYNVRNALSISGLSPSSSMNQV